MATKGNSMGKGKPVLFMGFENEDFFLSPELEAAGSKGEGKDKGKEEPNMALVALHAFRKGKAASKTAGKDKGKEEPKGKGKGKLTMREIRAWGKGKCKNEDVGVPDARLTKREVWALGYLGLSWREVVEYDPDAWHIIYNRAGRPVAVEDHPLI